MNRENVAIIIRGPSGVGKSTIAAILHDRIPHSAHIDVDGLKHMISLESSESRTRLAHRVAQYFVKQLVKENYAIIIEEIFRDNDYRNMRALFLSSGYVPITVFLRASVDVVLERNHARTGKIKDDSVIETLHREIVPGTDDIIIDVGSGGNDATVDQIVALLKDRV